ncbi:hypothetical protein BJY00DRAFT_311709 [Aspergillus carlsbadensis]|nr:hypothetical protein BJY00DRAFT_311709 [Aspergillus carlsbadensis]
MPPRRPNLRLSRSIPQSPNIIPGISIPTENVRPSTVKSEPDRLSDKKEQDLSTNNRLEIRQHVEVTGSPQEPNATLEQLSDILNASLDSRERALVLDNDQSVLARLGQLTVVVVVVVAVVAPAKWALEQAFHLGRKQSDDAGDIEPEVTVLKSTVEQSVCSCKG